MADNIIEIQALTNRLGGQLVHEDLNLRVKQHEILAIVGGSGSGKTTILRSILMLLQPSGGSIRVFDTDIMRCSEAEAVQVRRRWGVMFQKSALFSSLTVLENVMFPLQEFTQLSPQRCQEIALLKMAFVGLPFDAAQKYPAQLSGGMQKRTAAARAIALDPELLFLDEPTAGLDAKSAAEFEDLVLHLRNVLGLTIVLITHDLSTLRRICDRVAFLGERKVLACLPFAELMQQKHPLIQDYFSVVSEVML